MKTDTQLMIRRRRGDALNHIWQGYDEIDNISGKSTGKIVLGWHVNADGDVVNDYADEPPEIAASRSGIKTDARMKAVNAFVREETIVADGEPYEATVTPPASGYFTTYPVSPSLSGTLTLGAGVGQITLAPNTTIVGATVQYVVTFDWHYGSERMVFVHLAEINPWRKVLEAKFGYLQPTNWKLVKETVVIDDVQWPA